MVQAAPAAIVFHSICTLNLLICHTQAAFCIPGNQLFVNKSAVSAALPEYEKIRIGAHAQVRC